MKSEKYLVTGGCGFCGVEIVKYLIFKNCQVRIIDIDPLPEELKNLPNIEYIKGNIKNEKIVDESLNGIDRVIHTVAKVPISKNKKEFLEVNVFGTRNVMKYSLKNK